MDCVFCKIVAGEIDADKFYENEDFIAIKDIHPRTKGHSLLIPKKHYKDFFELPEELYGKFWKSVKEVCDILREEVGAEGFNFIVNNGKEAGQIVEHLHLHILPRKKGDGYRVNA